ncbi:MAG: hypothetical protein SGI92_15820 [Bryobacteraceae bacterium]|nr:hypothetical protein [Bryobacteraceae bacterium]
MADQVEQKVNAGLVAVCRTSSAHRLAGWRGRQVTEDASLPASVLREAWSFDSVIDVLAGRLRVESNG